VGLPVTQALPVRVTRALREGWGRKLGHAHLLEYSGDPADLERVLRARVLSRPFVLVLVPRNVYVWGVPQLADLRRYFRGVASLDVAVMDDVLGTFAGAPSFGPTTVPSAGRRVWIAVRMAIKVGWYALWLPTLPWWVLRYERALRSLQGFARRAGCRLFVLATPVPLRSDTGWLPGLHWYVALLAHYLRTKAGDDVMIADLYDRLGRADREALYLYHDRMVHLTAYGTEQAAQVVIEVIAEGAARQRLLIDSR
jgi:hypothetical protein